MGEVGGMQGEGRGGRGWQHSPRSKYQPAHRHASGVGGYTVAGSQGQLSIRFRALAEKRTFICQLSRLTLRQDSRILRPGAAGKLSSSPAWSTRLSTGCRTRSSSL